MYKATDMSCSLAGPGLSTWEIPLLDVNLLKSDFSRMYGCARRCQQVLVKTLSMGGRAVERGLKQLSC